MIICITGVPGCGKSTIAKELSKKMNIEVLDISRFSIENKLYENYDDAYNTYIVDEEKLFSKIDEYIKNKDNIIIEGNFSHLYNKCDICIIIKTDPNILYKRLKERNYPYYKIFENIWAMNLEVLEDELESIKRPYYIFFNNNKEDIEIIVKNILEIINKG
ncbi:putative adenylate kinase [Nanobdella aerobiophila]|uniref:Putative adenylate kinase n=1 Tax=Nanobdella aerobiophila TaxID=2586965 RepID=A0A915SI48_9ARCH|nr:adenylate kinase family protein [Nanobdella aerobiophila]BBL45407.1 putative adenylate kinase [Nanobdella aerobiophila]